MDRHASFRRHLLQPALKPFLAFFVLRLRRQEQTRPLIDLLPSMRFAVRHDPGVQFLIRSAGQYLCLKYLRVDPQKVDEIFIEPNGEVIVILNPAGMPEPDLVDHPSEVGNAAEERFRATRILL